MAERDQKILSYLKTHNLVTVDELVKQLGASPSTIRRDIIRLDQEGVIYRVHGGITLSRFVQSQPTTSEKAHQHHNEKELIGKAAASLIKPGDSIILDAGTTTIEIAKYITKLPLKVITSDLHIGIYLADYQNIEVSVTGGLVDWSSQSCIGITATEMMNKIHPILTFVSCNAFNCQDGITAPTNEKAVFKATLLSQSSKRILVADSSKYGKTQLFEVAPLKSIDMLITDRHLPDEAREQIENMGIKVMLV